MKKIYDNSNLAESYAGVTTPLTFSFARYVYEHVYHNFCRLMGVKEEIIQKNHNMFAHMVEFIGCQMYYDLINWYKMISFLPGYSLNRVFFEKMLGVQKSHNYQKNRLTGPEKLLEFLDLVFQVTKIVFTLISMKFLVERFNRDFDKTYEDISQKNLEAMDLIELKETFWQTAGNLVRRWRVPIANDLAVMVSTGLADKAYRKFAKDESFYLVLKNWATVPIISLDPGREIMGLAEIIKNNENLLQRFLAICDKRSYSTFMSDSTNNEISQKINSYLSHYGSRSPNELKLETPSFDDDPLLLIQLIKMSLKTKTQNPKNSSQSNELRRLSWPKKAILNFLVNWSIASIARREETRLRRSVIFGYTRKVFLSMGNIFENKGYIDKKSDIFYLKMEEIFAAIDRKEYKELRVIIDKNKKIQKFWSGRDLPRRIETSLTVASLEKTLIDQSKMKEKPSKQIVKSRGTIASRPANVMVGETLVLKEFDHGADFTDKILITCQTDPGWTVVFSSLKGIVVERGGMLSHAAIVAREMGIPCIIGVQNATDIFVSNKTVKMDMIEGTIEYV
jgi:pyruvate,water dikinase